MIGAKVSSPSLTGKELLYNLDDVRKIGKKDGGYINFSVKLSTLLFDSEARGQRVGYFEDNPIYISQMHNDLCNSIYILIPNELGLCWAEKRNHYYTAYALCAILEVLDGDFFHLLHAEAFEHYSLLRVSVDASIPLSRQANIIRNNLVRDSDLTVRRVAISRISELLFNVEGRNE